MKLRKDRNGTWWRGTGHSRERCTAPFWGLNGEGRSIPVTMPISSPKMTAEKYFQRARKCGYCFHVSLKTMKTGENVTILGIGKQEPEQFELIRPGTEQLLLDL